MSKEFLVDIVDEGTDDKVYGVWSVAERNWIAFNTDKAIMNAKATELNETLDMLNRYASLTQNSDDTMKVSFRQLVYFVRHENYLMYFEPIGLVAEWI